uniref:O-GlcNAc transferase C-terminal domain-containing protein n=2 Tax=Aplanochytrium stocchinoi TaxID=215587 RepID=A0A7S3LP16_9STRA
MLFLRQMPHNRFVSLLRTVNAVLDVFPNSRETTVLLDAVQAGTPVISCPSLQVYSSFAPILCKSYGIEKYCIAENQTEFVELAIQMANNVSHRQAFTAQLNTVLRNK